MYFNIKLLIIKIKNKKNYFFFNNKFTFNFKNIIKFYLKISSLTPFLLFNIFPVVFGVNSSN